jgi:glycosyltransferase involved in cell wall biosynthesis
VSRESLSIIFPTSGSGQFIFESLRSIAKVAGNPFIGEILLVVNGPRNKLGAEEYRRFIQAQTAEVANKFRVIHEPVPGLLAGRHRGAAEATGPFLSFIDDDVLLGDDWARSVEEICISGALSNRIAGGSVSPDFRGPTPSWLSKLTIDLPQQGTVMSELSLISISGDDSHQISPLFVFGLNFTVSKKALYDLGGFGPDLTPKKLLRFRGNGETAVAEELISRGEKAIWHPGLSTRHIIGTERLNLRYLCRIWMRQGISEQFQKIKENFSTGTFGEINVLGSSRQLVAKSQRILSAKTKIGRGKALGLLRLVCLWAGKNFLWHHYRNDQKVKEWVEQENYFNYSYPA